MKIDIFHTDKKYDIIYADPPWQYRDNGVPGGAEQHYHTMPLADIQSLPINSIANDNAVLFIWVTFPLLQEGLDTIKAWGFEYKTIAFNWVKWNKHTRSWFIGLGSYTRSNSEVCLLATKGNGLKRKNMGISSVIDWPVMEHSKKPPIVRKQIVQLLGDVSKIELFARDEHKGWDCFGDEV